MPLGTASLSSAPSVGVSVEGGGDLQEEEHYKLGPYESHVTAVIKPWIIQQAGGAKAWAYAGNKDLHFIVRVLETQNSKSKSVYFVTLQGNSLEGRLA